MANIYVEAKGPQGPQVKESLVPAAVSGYTRGLAVNYGTDVYHCALVAAAAAAALGILEEDAISTKNPCSVVQFGQVVAQIGASVTAGQQLTTDANSRLVPATAGQPVVAIALEPQTYVSPGSFACVLFFGPFGPMSAAVTTPVTYYTASGAIPVANGVAALNAATPLAMTLATPTTPGQDGVEITIIAETAQAHTVTTAGNKINGASSVITFASIGDSVTLQSMGGIWTVKAVKGTASVAPSVTNYSASGAISATVGMATIGGAAADAMTLVQPSVAQESTFLLIEATTAHAHTVTTSADGINGVDDTVTFAAVGDFVLLEARNQKWIVRAIGGPTPASLSEV
jgi:hypothetical protein